MSTVGTDAASSAAPLLASRRRSLLAHLGLAVAAYVPFLLSAPGKVSVDTKLYLYLHPERLLSDAAYLWDPGYSAGTVTHQNIGYLWPMGPFYWTLHTLGLPVWIAQRLWFGSILFAAGAGVLFLLRTFGRRDLGALAAAAIYMLSPYLLSYSARQSVILLPWAGLPWLIGLTERALRSGRWRQPAAFALIVFTIGGTNATALLFAGLAPILWILFRWLVDHDVTASQALRTAGRIGVLVLVTAVWWIGGLAIQGGYGLNVLDYTETVRAVAAASSSLEVLRGLGNWFFYGNDGLGSWITQSVQYQQEAWLLVVTFTIPIAALASGVLVRWKHRAYFVALTLLGLVLAVGVYPYDDPSLVGRVLKGFGEGSSVGLAMRSTARATPLVALGLAVLLGIGVGALLDRRRRVGIAAGVAAIVVAVLALAPLWQTDLVAENLRRPAEVPEYWQDAARYLDAQGDDTRVLELPGQDFANFRWGATIDPLLPALTERPWVGRELVPYGSQASADLLTALDRRLEEGLVEPDAYAAVARLFAAGDVLIRYDLEYERYRSPRPRVVAARFESVPTGLDDPVEFGPARPNVAASSQPMLDPVELAIPAGTADPAPISIYPVQEPEPIVRTAPTVNPVLIAGDGEGIVDAAAAGVIDGRTTVIESASYATRDTALRRLLDRDADLVVTDTNRRRVRHWGATRDVTGYTEQAGETALVDDAGDARLEPFGDVGDDTRTVTILRGVRSVQATAYGDPVILTPEDRPAHALDGDLATAWREGAGVDPTGERLVVTLDEPVTTDGITLVQPQNGLRDRHVTTATLTFDGGDPVTVELGPESLGPDGQRVSFPERTFERLAITVDAVTEGGGSGVGFAEVAIPGITVDEVVRMPTDLLDAAGDASLDHDLTLLMTRLWGAQQEYGRSDEELAIVRTFDLPTARSFALTGTARIDATAPDDVLDALLGLPGAADGGVSARASSRLEGDVRSRASAAVDGDPATAWVPAFVPASGGGNVGQQLSVDLPGPTTLDHLDLELVADGRHSVPTKLTITPAGGTPFTVDVPAVADGADAHHTERATVSFPAVTTTGFTVAIDQVRSVTTPEYFSHRAIELPVGIAELGIPGVTVQPATGGLEGACRSDLLEVDGRPVPLRVTGSVADAVARSPLTVEPCGADAESLLLEAGAHDVRATPGRESGIDLDRLSFASSAGGAPRTEALLGQSGGQQPGPDLEITHQGHLSYDLEVTGATKPFWLVVAQSKNDGWTAELDDGTSLGEPELVDGMANGWTVPAPKGGHAVIHVRWTPQDRVWVGLAISGLGVLVCLVLLLVRRRPAIPASDADASVTLAPFVARTAVRPRTLVLVGLPILVGVLTLLVASPILALVAAALSAGAMLDRRARTALRVVAIGALLVAVGFVIVQQVRQGYPAAYDWPQRFLKVDDLPWLAVLLLAADVVIDRLPGNE